MRLGGAASATGPKGLTPEGVSYMWRARAGDSSAALGTSGRSRERQTVLVSECEEHARASPGGRQGEPFEAQGKQAPALHMGFGTRRSRLTGGIMPTSRRLVAHGVEPGTAGQATVRRLKSGRGSIWY